MRAYVKKIPIGPGKSIRSTIWQGNRISNNDATLIIMRLPPYRSVRGNEAKEVDARERPGVFPVSRNCCRRAILRWNLVKYFQETFLITVIVSLLRTNYRFAISNEPDFAIEWSTRYISILLIFFISHVDYSKLIFSNNKIKLSTPIRKYVTVAVVLRICIFS